MRKGIGIAMAIAASLGAGLTVQAVGNPLPANQQQSQQDKQTPPKQTSTTKQRISINPYGGLDFTRIGSGLSPKEYGMWLQSRGKQKWIK